MIYLVISIAPVHAQTVDNRLAQKDTEDRAAEQEEPGLVAITGAQASSGLIGGGLTTLILGLLLWGVYLYTTYGLSAEQVAQMCTTTSFFSLGITSGTCWPWYILTALLVIAGIIMIILAFTVSAEPDAEESDQFKDTQGDGVGAKENIPDLKDDIKAEIKSNEATHQPCTQADADRSFLKGERQKTESQYRYLVTYRVSGCSDASTFSLSFQGDKTENIKSGTISKGQIAEDTLTIESKTLFKQVCLKLGSGKKCVTIS